jgi:hypothetical protein
MIAMKISECSTLGLHVRQIYSEYLEMPGLRLTAPQACRLLGLDPATGQVALDALVETRFLRLTDDGLYVRLTDGAVDRRDVA